MCAHSRIDGLAVASVGGWPRLDKQSVYVSGAHHSGADGNV